MSECYYYTLLIYVKSIFLLIFQQLFQQFLHLSRPYKRRHVVSFVEINACDTSLSWQARAFLKSTGKSLILQVNVSAALLFYTIHCRIERLAQSGRKHLSGDCLSYRNALHMHISTRLNFGQTMPENIIITFLRRVFCTFYIEPSQLIHKEII